MSAPVKDAAWLKRELGRLLGLDDFIVDSVVDTIANAVNRAEIDDLVQVGS